MIGSLRCDVPFRIGGAVLFTLSFPITLPPEHTFFDNARYPVPPLPGGLSVRCISNEHAPVVLRIAGFASQRDAIDFCSVLRDAIRGASLESDHSMIPSGANAVVSELLLFDGSAPTVTATSLNAMPCVVTTLQQNQLHVSVLSKAIGDCIARGLPANLNANPGHRLSLELFSELEFAGGMNAQFVMLLTALEVLVPKTSSKGKRGSIAALVKATYAAAGHADKKTINRKLNDMYAARNALVHDAKEISRSELAEMKEIVRTTLKLLTS